MKGGEHKLILLLDEILSAPNSGSVLHVLKNTADGTYNHEKFLRCAVSLKIIPEDLLDPNEIPDRRATTQEKRTPREEKKRGTF